MFGRHPRLAVDAFLGLPQSQQQVRSRQDYVDKLKQWMAFAYDTASSEARKSADRQKGYYDDKVRYMNLEVGDRVLVKNVGLRGKQKLADLWEHCPYVVRSQPVPAIPVFEVVKENSGPLQTFKQQGLLKLIDCAFQRKDYEMRTRMQAILDSQADKATFGMHKSCYSTSTSKDHIRRHLCKKKKEGSPDTDDVPAARIRRSHTLTLRHSAFLCECV